MHRHTQTSMFPERVRERGEGERAGVTGRQERERERDRNIEKKGKEMGHKKTQDTKKSAPREALKRAEITP